MKPTKEKIKIVGFWKGKEWHMYHITEALEQNFITDCGCEVEFYIPIMRVYEGKEIINKGRQK